MEEYLPGCGVCFVHWIPNARQQPLAKVGNHKNPVDALNFLRSVARKMPPSPERLVMVRAYNRVWKKLLRYNINSWIQLEIMELKDFRSWRNYGQSTHKWLVKIAADYGYRVVSWE